jgi:hypothetical protein
MGLHCPDSRFKLYNSGRETMKTGAHPHVSNKPDSDVQPDSSGQKQQQNSKRFVFTTWPNGLDREMCAFATLEPPLTVPSIGRTGLATAAWTPVQRTETAILICNLLHEGECAWPYAVGSA